MELIKKILKIKKCVFFGIIFAGTFASFAEKSKLTIKNTFGGDSEALGEYDLFTHSKELQVSGNEVSRNIFALGNKIQLDFENSFITSRFGLEVLFNNSDLQEIPKFVFVPAGFINYSPIKQISFCVGNNYSKLFAIPSGYLAAADDTTKYARILTDSLGYETYVGSDSVALVYNGFCAGVSGNLSFGKESDLYFKPAVGVMLYSDSSNFDYSVDFGFNAGKNNLIDFGFAAHNVLDASRKLGAFAGLTLVQNLILNLGVYYNFTASDYLPEYRVQKNDSFDFKKQKSKYALGVSGGYDFKKLGLGVYADFISGITNEYIGNVKYYDKDGKLIQTETKTIVRGQSGIKYVNGVAKKNDEVNHYAIPFYAQLRLSYDISKSVNLGLRFKVCSLWYDYTQNWFMIYPNVSFELPSALGTINTGFKIDINQARYESVSAISIPLSYTYKFKTKI